MDAEVLDGMNEPEGENSPNEAKSPSGASRERKTSIDEDSESWEGKPLWRQASRFIAAVASGRDVEDSVFEQRHVSCHGTKPDGTVVGAPCVMRRESEKHGYYCNACGCGDTKLANLMPDPKSGKSKLQFVKLTCPLGRKGFSNERDRT